MQNSTGSWSNILQFEMRIPGARRSSPESRIGQQGTIVLDRRVEP
jgi:hypothetical protein